LKSLLWTISFLTIIPTGKSSHGAPPSMAWIALWFPVVGLALGFVLSACFFGTMILFSGPERMELRPGPIMPTIITLAVYVILTRALHLDGLADSADGLMGAVDRDKRLAIMRDSRIGTFGMIAVFFALVAGAAGFFYAGWHVAFGDLERLPKQDIWALALLISPMPMVGRWAMVFMTAMSPYARTDAGTGKDFCDAMRPVHFWVASMVPTAVLILCLGPAAAIIWVAAVSTYLVFTAYCWRKIGGATGDTIGATGVLAETGYLIALVAVLRAAPWLIRPLIV
jgi:adenosylcobinamide-GDP ribazoletransferase